MKKLTSKVLLLVFILTNLFSPLGFGKSDSALANENFKIATELYKSPDTNRVLKYTATKDNNSIHFGNISGKEIDIKMDVKVEEQSKSEKRFYAYCQGEITIGDDGYGFTAEGEVDYDKSKEPFIFGSLDGYIKTISGQECIVVNLHYSPDTGEVIMPINIGTLFGDSKDEEYDSLEKYIFGKPFEQATIYVSNMKNEEILMRKNEENEKQSVLGDKNAQGDANPPIPYRDKVTRYKSGYPLVTVAAYADYDVAGDRRGGDNFSMVRAWAHSDEATDWYNDRYNERAYMARVIKARQMIEQLDSFYVRGRDPNEKNMETLEVIGQIAIFVPALEWLGTVAAKYLISSLRIEDYTYGNAVTENSTEWIKTRTVGIRRIDLPRRADPRTETDYGIRSKRWCGYRGTDYGANKRCYAGNNLMYEVIGEQWVDSFWTGTAWADFTVKVVR